MTQAEKKTLILKRIERGDARSYNEIAADMELDIWRERYGGAPPPQPPPSDLKSRRQRALAVLEKNLENMKDPSNRKNRIILQVQNLKRKLELSPSNK